jgi:hypothetical protein
VTHQDEFARRVTAALDQGLGGMDASTHHRLAFIRRQAIKDQTASRYQGSAVLVWAHRHARMAAVLLLTLIIASWWFLQPSSPPYSAEIDILLLTGELPPAAYADNTFSQWLETHATF